jgi:NADH-quinone oxidoreductase subunit A
MLFLLFDVEVVFFWPWAPLFAGVAKRPAGGGEAAARLISGGYGKAFLLGEMGIFLLILLVGYVYAWRKGVFRWT